MRAAMILEQGADPVVCDTPAPEARAGATLVDVTMAGIGRTDIARAKGTIRAYVGPHVVNGEGVGTAGGRRVYFGHSVAPFGALAQRALVPDDWWWPIPDGLSDELAIALGISGTAALCALETAQVHPGDRVLVLGATGIVGQVALQAARALGASYVAAAGRDASTLSRLEREGIADATVCIGTGDADEQIKALAGKGWDVVVDAIFGPAALAALKTMAAGGRMVVMGNYGGASIALGPQHLIWKTLTAINLNDVSGERKRALHERLGEMAIAGQLAVPTHVFSLDQVGAAWDALAGSAHAKVLVRP